jgi:hypothetical protein
MKVSLLLLAAVVVGAIGTIIATIAAEKGGSVRAVSATVRLRDEGRFPALTGATDWLNTPPLSAGDLRGKVVLIDFWTYT